MPVQTPQTRTPLAPEPSGIAQIQRASLLALCLPALLTVAGQGVVQNALGHHWSARLLVGGLGLVTLMGLAAAAALPRFSGRVRTLIDAQHVLEARLAAQDAEIAEADKQVTALQATLENLSTVDALTGLPSHRAFQERLDTEMGRALRHGHPLSLLLLDIDKFKSYNQAYGHPSGDRALQVVAQTLRESGRAGDWAARYGGEEFALILTDTDRMGATVLGERLRRAIEDAGGLERPLTVSVGLTTLTPRISGTAELLAEADRALCHAKGEGRNRVSHAVFLPVAENAEEDPPEGATRPLTCAA